MSDALDDGFQVVKSKRKNRKASYIKAINADVKNDVDSDPRYVLELFQKVERCKSSLRDYDENLYWLKVRSDFQKALSDVAAEAKHTVDIVCFGLGSIDESLSSRYQLAMLLLLLDNLKESNNNSSGMFELDSVSLFDPVFNEADKKLLKDSYKFRVLDNNTQCMHRVAPDAKRLTIFYMPHCGKALYNNLLFSNWSTCCLSKLMILGNDFRTIEALSSEENMDRYYSYIKDSLNLLTCHKVNSECSVTNAFEDFCIQYFETKNLKFPEHSTVCKNQLIDESDLIGSLEHMFSKLRSPTYEESEEIIS